MERNGICHWMQKLELDLTDRAAKIAGRLGQGVSQKGVIWANGDE